MDLSLEQEILQIPDLRHRVRHLKWFRRSFRRCTDLVTTHFGPAFEVSEARLVKAFLNWAENFERQKSCARVEARDFAVFAGGLMLQELLREPAAVPKRAVRTLGQAHPIDAIVDFWPAGFVATSYCVSVLNAVARQDFEQGFVLQPEAADLRVWQSFRENVAEEPARAVAFMDMFLGFEPNWAQPEWAPARPRMRRALERAAAASHPRLH